MIFFLSHNKTNASFRDSVTSVERGWSVVVDARSCPHRHVKQAASTIRAALGNIRLLLVLRADGFWDKQRVDCRKTEVDNQVGAYPEYVKGPIHDSDLQSHRDFQRQPRPNFPCMGSGNRNHHHDLQIAVAVAVDQNFLIFSGRFGHQRRGPTLLLSENWERLNRSVAACVGRPSTATATAIWLHIAVAIEILGPLKGNFLGSAVSMILALY